MAEATTRRALRHYDAVEASLRKTLASACRVTTSPETGDEARTEDESADGALLVIISLVGDVEWSVFLGFPRRTAVAVGERFFGAVMPFESEDLSDCIGELGNIFAGELRAHLERRGIAADMSLPIVMRGAGIHLFVGRSCPNEGRFTTTELGRLWCKVVSGKEGPSGGRPAPGTGGAGTRLS
jgi:CheY-specific phosphatase CheX